MKHAESLHHRKNLKVILANMFDTKVATNIDNGYIVSDSCYCSTLTCAVHMN